MQDTVQIENEESLRDKLLHFIYNELLPFEKENEIDSEKEIPMEHIQWVRKRSKELGFYGISLPKELGGQLLNLKGLCVLKEELTKSGAVLWGHILGEIGGPLRIGKMLKVFSQEQREKYVMPVINAEAGCCFALSEPEAGSDAKAIQTTAVRDGDDYILHGKKHFISAAPYADWAIVIAKEIVEEGGERVTAFIVEKKLQGKSGFELGKIQVPISGERSTAELIFNHCRVPSSNILGEPGKGLLLGLSRINENRASWGATYLGVAQRLLNLSIDHAKHRIQFGRPIGEFQAIQHMLAEMATEIYAARSMLYDVIKKIDNGEDVKGASSMVKVFSSEVANRVADKAVQIFGGQGLMKGHPVEKMYRDVRMFRILTGTSEIQKNTIAKELLKK
ncbi:acyl-CoA dehydrogenase family protein [Peribacillus frigoritolerans]|uniref:acyl-CoA dehydrogenase family protein n=1 Tax=Peribacillus frigoritolerans TaxID=450367 RepID=UPI0024BF3B59|nr:acyl-CoA dehydrogenase family protein [Peribacillus frigoritolerans]WHY15328.1 acyl-CoA dehydrogenase family protein [Peribacillus frigoritolerans]